MTAEREPIAAPERDVHALRVVVAGQPIAWQRPSSGPRKHTRRHDAYLQWRDLVGWHALDELNRQRLPKPMAPADWDVHLDLTYVGADAAADVDNLTKATLDALSGIVYHDDRQVCRTNIARHPPAAGMRGLIMLALAPAVPVLADTDLQRLADAHHRQEGD